jgi:hypothetical protein
MNSLPFKGRERVGMVFYETQQVTHPPPNLPLEGGGEERVPGLEKILYEREERTYLSSAAVDGS